MDPDILYVVVAIAAGAVAAIGGLLELRRGTEHDVRPLEQKVAALEAQVETTLRALDHRIAMLEDYGPVRDEKGRFIKRGP